MECACPGVNGYRVAGPNPAGELFLKGLYLTPKNKLGAFQNRQQSRIDFGSDRLILASKVDEWNHGTRSFCSSKIRRNRVAGRPGRHCARVIFHRTATSASATVPA